MKKSFYVVSVATLAMTMFSCGSKSSSGGSSSDKKSDSAAVDSADAEVKKESATVEIPTEDPAEIEAGRDLIAVLYNNLVLNYGSESGFSFDEETQFVDEKMTPEFKQKLMDAYVSEFEGEEPGLAYFVLRTDAQDGDGYSGVRTIDYIGDGWYKVSFLDQGNKGTKEIKVEGNKLADYRD